MALQKPLSQNTPSLLPELKPEVKKPSKKDVGKELSARLLEVIPKTMWSIRTLMREVMRELSQNELTIPQFRILVYIARKPGLVSELAEFQGVSLPAMSKMIDMLVGRGLLEKSSQIHDKRCTPIHLTAEGRRQFLAIRKRAELSLRKRLSKLPEIKKTALFEALMILEEILP